MSAVNSPPDSAGVPVNGLQMSRSYGSDSAGGQRPTRYPLAITFSNLTRSKIALLLGTGCDPKAMGPTMGVKLNLRAPNGKIHRSLPFLGEGPPYRAGCAGGIYVSVVTLQPGASKSFPLHLGEYLDLSSSTKYREASFPAGTYSIQAALTVQASGYDWLHRTGARVWTGTITSNFIPVRFAKEFAAPLGDYPNG